MEQEVIEMPAAPSNEVLAGIRRGLHFDVDIDVYHSGPGISKSGLDDINANPAIYYARHLDPSRPPPKSRAGQLEGALAHCAILEPAEFNKRYAVGPDVIRSTKVWKEFEAAHPGMECIKPDQYEAAHRQADSVRRLSEIAEALQRGMAEVSAYWTDPATGELCRCRPDWVYQPNETGAILLDVKTCSDAKPSEFARQVARKAYDKQAAFYTDGYGIASGKTVHGFIFLAVETEWPFAASACMLDEDGVEIGRRAYRRNLNTYSECLKSGMWPGYSESIEIIRLPKWLTKEEEA